MREFCRHIAKFLAVMTILVVAIGVIKEKYPGRTRKRAILESNIDSMECIIIGSSHTLHGLDPSLFPVKTINIAEVNKPMCIDLKILSANIGKMHKLKYVIIPVEYFTLHYTGNKDRFVQKMYKHWSVEDENKRMPSFLKFHFMTCGFDIFENRQELPKSLMSRDKGFDPDNKEIEVDQKELRLQSLARLEQWKRYWIDTATTSSNYNQLEDMILFLQSKGVTPILVTMPVTPEMEHFYDSDIVKTNDILIGNIIQKNNVPYIDFQKDTALHHQYLFFDQDHLNTAGSIIASKRVAQLIEKLEEQHTQK
jgi:lysophospholipase L1-like esterase